jgi:hypothetical protein
MIRPKRRACTGLSGESRIRLFGRPRLWVNKCYGDAISMLLLGGNVANATITVRWARGPVPDMLVELFFGPSRIHGAVTSETG